MKLNVSHRPAVIEALPARTMLRAMLLSLCFAAMAVAIQPQKWEHNTQTHFQAGTRVNSVVTNLGDLKLAARSRTVGEMPEDVTAIFAMQPVGDRIYLSVGPASQLMVMEGDEVKPVLDLEQQQVFALHAHGDKLLVGVSAEGKSRLATLEGDELKTLAAMPEDVRYIWDVVHDAQKDVFYVATGTEGRIYRVNPAVEGEGQATIILDSKVANILCLGMDGQGRLYAGTDSQGLIYRLTFRDEVVEPFVLYDASEPEIGALLVMPDGTVYAGTADARQARPGSLTPPTTRDSGRPDDAPDAQAPDLPEPEPDPAATDGMPAAPDADADADADADGDTPDGDTPVDNTTDAAADAPAPQPAPDTAPDVAPDAAPDAAPAQPVTPTAEQRDTLRQEIRARLMQARQTGVVPMQEGTPPVLQGQPAQPRPGQPAGQPAQQRARGGNAIYHITPDGFVNDIFRESVMILKIIEHEGGLLVATGNEGQLYLVKPNSDERVALLDLDVAQITALTPRQRGDDTEIVLATANKASVVILEPRLADEGTYTSEVLDAQQISLWGAFNALGLTPNGTRITVQARSGNVSDPEQGMWSNWTDPLALEPRPADPHGPRTARFDREALPPARFFQYRLTLSSDGSHSAVVNGIEMHYVMPNMRPRVRAVEVEVPRQRPQQQQQQQRPGADPGPTPQIVLNLKWQADDPNGDTLIYTIEYQAVGTRKWLKLVDNHSQPQYQWDTRRVPDGRYRVRITASDAPDNPGDMALTDSRVSQMIVIDNTPPDIEDAQVRVEDGVAHVSLTLKDALSPIEELRYSVDADETWHKVLPVDLIYDSTEEAFAFKIPDLSPGPHVITLRAVDAQGNARYKALYVDGPAKR